MLISSHVLAEVAQTVDQVLIISRGRLVIESPLAELTARAGGAVRVPQRRPAGRLTAALAQQRSYKSRPVATICCCVQGASSRAGW